MATLSTPPAERARAVLGKVATAVLAVGLLAGGAAVFAVALGPSVESRYFPWITGRALGIASYLCLFALVGLGLALRHPWRARFRRPHPESLLRVHALLGTATVALVLAHIAFLAGDRYAGVGWLGALVPGLSHYRPGAVALGVVGAGLVLVVAATARLAGRRGGRHWHTFHHLAGASFVLVWLHGVLAGTDTGTLRPLYLASGALLVLLAASRSLARGDALEHAGPHRGGPPTGHHRPHELEEVS